MLELHFEPDRPAAAAALSRCVRKEQGTLYKEDEYFADIPDTKVTGEMLSAVGLQRLCFSGLCHSPHAIRISNETVASHEWTRACRGCRRSGRAYLGAADDCAAAALTAADYARAEKFMAYNTTPLVLRSGVRPTWLPDGRFWYRITTEKGSEAFLVDPVKAGEGAVRAAGLRRPAAAAERAAGPPAGGGGRGAVTQRRALAGRQARRLHPRLEPVGARRRHRPARPQLTTDGVKDFGYATDNAGWTQQRPADRRVVARLEEDRDLPAGPAQASARCTWSTRKVGHPDAAGVEVSAARRRGRHDDPARRHRRRRGEGASRLQDAARPAPLDALRRRRVPRRRLGRRAVELPTARRVAFVSTSRDHKQRAAARRRRRRPARSATCSRRRSRRSSSRATARVNWRYLPASNEVIWFSERDNWGQLYLYDLQTGKLKHQITTRRGQRHAAAARRREEPRGCYFLGVGQREGPRSVLHALLSRSAWTARTCTLLTPEDADHDVVAVAVGPSTSSTATRSPTCRRSPCCATPTAS